MKFPQDFTRLNSDTYTHPDGWRIVLQYYNDWAVYYNDIDMSPNSPVFGYAGVQAIIDAAQT